MKLLKALIAITFTAMLFMLGIYVGIQIQYQEELDNQARDYGIQTTIAVVNLDVGVQDENKAVKNYSSAIIDGLDSNYVLVSSAMADSGYNSGKYGAVLTFPAGLSAAIESINTENPYQAEITFKVNSNLPQEKYIQIYTELLTLQSQINQSVTYMYMDSILEEFHNAQNEVNALMENNNELLDEAEKVILGNYAATIEMAEIPRKEFEPKPVEIVNFVNNASEYAESVSRLYLSSYAVAQKDFDKVEEEMGKAAEELDAITKNWIKEVELWTKEVEDYNSLVRLYVSEVDVFGQALDEWAGKLEIWEQQSNTYTSELCEYDKLITKWLEDINDYRDELEEFCMSADNFYSEEMLQQNVEQWNEWKKEINEIYTIAMANSELYNAFGTEAVAVMEQYHEAEQSIDEWINYSEAVTKWGEELEEYRSSLVIEDEAYTDYMGALELYQNSIAAYKAYYVVCEEELNSKIEEVNEVIEGLNDNTESEEKILIDKFEISDKTAEEYEKINTQFIKAEEKLVTEQEQFETWVDNYKTLSEELPQMDEKILKPEEIEKIDTTDLEQAEKDLSKLQKNEEMDMEVPEDIQLVMFDEELPVMEETTMPEWTLELPENVVNEKPIFDGQEPEYNLTVPPTRPNELLSNLEDLGKLVASYNPEEYLTDEVTGRISGIIGQYESYLGSVDQSIQSNQQSNLSMLMKNYSEYSVYLSELKTQIYQLHSEEQEKLQNGLNVFAANARTISDESKNYIIDFAGKLPYTRNNSVTNKMFIETAVTPLKFNNGNVAIQHSNLKQSENGEMTMRIVIVLFAIVMVMATAALVLLGAARWKKRRVIGQYN